MMPKKRKYEITEDDLRALQEIADGGKVTTERYDSGDNGFIIVENPDYRPDNGLDPNYVISLRRIRGEPEDYS